MIIGEDIMTVKELMEILKESDPDTEVRIEGRDSTGEYYDTIEMTEDRICTGSEYIVIDAG